MPIYFFNLNGGLKINVIKGGIRCSHIQPQVFNLRILSDKYFNHKQDLYHVLKDFKKAFYRVLHAAFVGNHEEVQD